MNAPWNAGSGNSDRDAFAAFLCDEATMDVVRNTTSELGLPHEKCHKGGLRNAVQTLSVSASPSILLVDLSECGDPLSDINALAEVCEPGTVVVAVGQVNDVRLYRDLTASGIQDYLLKPLTEDALRDALIQAQASFSAPRVSHDNGAARDHVMTAVVGTRGGVGASTIATSLGWMFSTEHKLPTALLDLDVHFGTGALTMDLEPGRGLTDAIDNPSRIDGLFIERAMVRANDNLSILSAEAPIHTPLMTDGSAFVQLEDEFRQAFDMTVVDLPRNMLINFAHILNGVNTLVLATELTLASARDAIRILSWSASHAEHMRTIVVANKVAQGAGEISRADFEASIERKIDYVIPADVKAATQAAKLGQVLVDANRASKASIALRDLARTIVASGGDADAGKAKGGSKGSLMDKFNLGSVLGAKQKA
ncbi:AAA family ATPase [Croceicoccus naphthovorans]|uniref:Pilus assembly protein CpaE n=1 Tax=Croceicoccus naphthovorans TaxID=1348774 RepID=A0A0G3XJL5_9SPHN|nr:pilus assembly protein CpaE [Croceicoccus naphthovorans]AKM10794.1 pilus assembly protein CpaE [Croceicoccus naphthovorans]MBB3989001.1 pilus assembly protein CpaE [Croceicoccus naphthovorans]